MPSNLEHIKAESDTNKNFKKVLLLYPALIIEAVLGVDVVNHDTFNQTVIAQLHSTGADQKVEELLSVLERDVKLREYLQDDKFKEMSTYLHTAFSKSVAKEDALKYYRSDRCGEVMNHLYSELQRLETANNYNFFYKKGRRDRDG